MNATDQAPAGTPYPGRALPLDRQLPGISWGHDKHRHYVPAGTLPQPGSRGHFRAPCGAVCLHMPPSREGWEYQYESLPLHPDCQPSQQ
jgi:hypothetical protein